VFATALAWWALCSGRELVFNGGFELPADSGWQARAWGEFPDTGNCRLRRAHDFAPDRDFEVMVHKMLHQGFVLTQRVDAPSLDLGFSFSARFTAKTERESLFAAGAVGLEFLGADDSVLGETRVYYATSGCDWQAGPALRLVRVPDTLAWRDFRFRVEDELALLPGVDPDSVRALRVALLAYVLGNG